MKNMGKIDERFAELEGFIEELSIHADQSKVSMETAQKFMNAIGNIKLESPENFGIYITSLKESSFADLQYFRDKVEIIRTVSPQTANYIESQILEFEKYYLRFIKDVEEYSKQGKAYLESQGEHTLDNSVKLIELGPKIVHDIELIHGFFQDTLEFLRKE